MAEAQKPKAKRHRAKKKKKTSQAGEEGCLDPLESSTETCEAPIVYSPRENWASNVYVATIDYGNISGDGGGNPQEDGQDESINEQTSSLEPVPGSNEMTFEQDINTNSQVGLRNKQRSGVFDIKLVTDTESDTSTGYESFPTSREQSVESQQQQQEKRIENELKQPIGEVRALISPDNVSPKLKSSIETILPNKETKNGDEKNNHIVDHSLDTKQIVADIVAQFFAEAEARSSALNVEKAPTTTEILSPVTKTDVNVWSLDNILNDTDGLTNKGFIRKEGIPVLTCLPDSCLDDEKEANQVLAPVEMMKTIDVAQTMEPVQVDLVKIPFQHEKNDEENEKILEERNYNGQIEDSEKKKIFSTEQVKNELSAEAVQTEHLYETCQKELDQLVEDIIRAETLPTAPQIDETDEEKKKGRQFITAPIDEMNAIEEKMFAKPKFPCLIGHKNLIKQPLMDPTKSMPGTAALVKIAHRKICVSQTLIPIWDGNVRPYTESQLKALYYNKELESNRCFIDQFVEEHRSTIQHELYELVMGYFRARNNLQVSSKDVQALHQEYAQSKDYLWITTDHTITNKSHCEDGKLVTGSYQYQRVKYSETSSNKINRLLKQIREQVYEHLSLYAYTAQMARLQVESYLHKVLMSSPDLKDIPHNSPVQGYSSNQLAPSVIYQVENLKQCISILFSFQRKPIKDKPFVQDTRTWLTRLVAVLLRMATYDDHLFILNHVLRCPSGVGEWAAAYIQPPTPRYFYQSEMFGDPNLDHAVTVLATMLRPIKYREEFLKHVKSAVMTASYLEDDDSMWVLIDSEGEEDEDPSNFWFQWRENDLVALLNQIPMEAVYRCMLGIDRRDDHDMYDPSQSNEQTMMKIFAFATQLVQIFREGLKTFNLVRYRQLAKRISRFIRHIVQYVSDHWQNFQLVHGPTETAIYTRVQIEFDQFFLRATYCIFSSQKLGSWQFMAGLPYTCVSTTMLWQIMRLLHGDYDEDQTFDTFVSADWQGELEDPSLRFQFEENLSALPECEAYYLLTSFANMACSRDNTARQLVEHIAMEIYDIAFVSTNTREICSKGGRELLTLVATKHPFILSIMVHRVKETMTQVGMAALYLFRELPFHLWQPNNDDLTVISDWLLCSQLTSPPNLLARLVLAAMNWSLNEQGEMYLSLTLHRKVALMVVEAYSKLVPTKAGLLAESFKQVTNIASMMCQTPTPSQAFCTWAWDLLLQLRLHLFSQPVSVIHHALLNPCEAFQTVPSLQRENLQLLVNGIKEKQPTAAYVALTMTTCGHSIAEFERNVQLITILMECHQYRSVIHMLSLITPMYFTNNASLHCCKSVPPIIQNLLMCDLTYIKMAKNLVLPEFPGKHLRMFVAMILHSAKTALDVHSTAADVFLMWLEIICNLNQWSRDRNALYVVDSICRTAFSVPEVMDSIKKFLYQHYKQLVENAKIEDNMNTSSRQTSVTSFLWWMTGNSPSSLVNRQSCPEFPWFTYCALNVQAEVEEESQLWHTLALDLLNNPRATPDVAIKRAASTLHLSLPTLNQLAIYHWAHQAVDTPADHPLNPLFWQRFFGLYLQRWTTTGQPDKGSIGSRFFDSMSNLPFLKKMKKRLHELIEYHQKQAKGVCKRLPDVMSTTDNLPANESDTLINPKTKLHFDLAKLYNTLVLWIEEPKLHESTLYLPSLPPQYDTGKLLQLQGNDKTPWLEFIDFEFIQKDHDKLIGDWVGIFNPKQRANCNQFDDGHRDSARDHILKRLRSYEIPKPPPMITAYKLPVPEVSDLIFDSENAIVGAVKEQMKLFTDYAKVFAQQMNQHIVLDKNYMDLMPELYKNADSETIITVPCKQGTTGLLRTTETKCSGPARITMKFRAKKMMDNIKVRIEQNRREHQELLNEMLCPPPQNVCSAAVFIENTIMNLVKRYQDRRQKDAISDKYEQMGVVLFYYVHELILVGENKQYPPTRQFLTSSIEILGQEFVNNNPNQCQTLLRVILSHPESVGLLAPHFNPAAASKENFINLYKALVAVTRLQNADLAFVLLTKFDVNLWLSSQRPKLSERQQIIQLIGEVLLLMGLKPEPTLLSLCEIYRQHMQSLLLYQFPDHYGDVLNLLFNGSESQTICVEAWYDLFNSLVMDNKSAPFPISTPAELREVCRRFGHNQIMFMLQQMKETLELLNSHFLQKRQSNKHNATYGLYQKYRIYLPAVRSFLSLVSHAYIYSAKENCDKDRRFEQEALNEVWPTICKAFSPWLQPFQLGARLSMPWVSGDVDAATSMATVFGDILIYLHEATDYSPNLLAAYLDYYACTCKVQGTTNFILSTVHNQIFSLFEWSKFHLTANPMKCLMQILDLGNEDCLSFLGDIFLQLPWSKIISTWELTESPLLTALHMDSFSTLTVRLAFEPHMSQKTHQLGSLLQATEKFPWHNIDARHYNTLVKSFVSNCNAGCILALPGLENDIAIYRFLRVVAGFVTWSAQLHPETREKRCSFIRMFGELLSSWTTKNKTYLRTHSDTIVKVLVKLLEDMEDVILANTISVSVFDQSSPVLTELVLLLNTVPVAALQDVIIHAILSWAAAHPCSPLLPPCLYTVCRSLASVIHMCTIAEALISSHFKADLVDLKTTDGGWTLVSAAVQVPELTEADFLNECIKQNNILTLYATIMQRQPQCNTSHAQVSLLSKVIDWITRLRPSEDAEGKMLLLWHKAIELSINQGLSDEDVRSVCSLLVNMCQTLTCLAEDKATTGFFGSIGLGKRSPYSLRFRLAARAVAAFVLSNIISNDRLRLKITDVKVDTPPADLRSKPIQTTTAAALASIAVSQLESCSGNKLYDKYQEEVAFLICFLNNQLQSLQDYQHLLSYLSCNLFNEKNYLKVLKRTDQVGLQLCTSFVGMPE